MFLKYALGESADIFAGALGCAARLKGHAREKLAILRPSSAKPDLQWSGFASAFGVQEDGESGLKLMGHRYYDPGTGRFITRDPIGSGTNWYRYCDNNPLKNVDPEGLVPEDVRKYPDYAKRVQDRIDSLKKNGEAKAAAKLQEMLDNGKIMIDKDPKAWEKQYPDGRRLSAAAKMSDDGSEIIINPNQFAISEYLESYLLHEVTHVFDYEEGLPKTEQNSTRVTIAYARRRAAQARRNRDGSEEQWGNIARSNAAEAAGFRARDIGRLGDFFKKLFGGARW